MKQQSVMPFGGFCTIFTILVLNFVPILFFHFDRTALFIDLLYVLFFSFCMLWKHTYKRDFFSLIANKWDVFQFIIPFSILYVSLLGTPQLIFLKFDTIAALVLSWFVFSLIWLNKRYASIQGSQDCPPNIYFFVLSASAVWILVVWNIGVGRLTNLNILTHQYDRLSDCFFYIWEHKPFSSHYFLTFRTLEDYDHKIAYAGYSPVFLLMIYSYVKLLAVILGLTIAHTTKYISIFYSCILAIVYAFTLINNKNKAPLKSLFTQTFVFLVLGLIVTIPSLWLQLSIQGAPDNAFPVIIYLILFLLVFVSRRNFTSSGFQIGIIALCALCPVYGILTVATLAFYAFYQNNQQNFPTIRKIFFVAVAVAVLSFVYPVVAVKITHYQSSSSSWLFRSGLDGDKRYYQNIFQAVVAPYDHPLSRKALIPELIFLVISYLAGGRRLLKEQSHLYAEYLFIFFPYLLTLVLWPQSVSIHPYLYDYMLELPLVFLAAAFVISPQVQLDITKNRARPFALLFILSLVSVLMYNLTDIAHNVRWVTHKIEIHQANSALQ